MDSALCAGPRGALPPPSLSYVVRFATQIRDTLDSLGYLSPRTADGFLAALQPLLPLHAGLRDHLMLVLRKTMFAKCA